MLRLAAEDETGEGEDGAEDGAPGQSRRSAASRSSDSDAPDGALASDEALAALRDELSGQS